MNVKRIVKQFAASMTSQVVILLERLLLAPVFIHFYNLAAYGDWLTLTASVGYLATLQFGVQTYVNNELTMQYSRGEMDTYQHLQSTALRMLLGAGAVASAIMAVVFFLPVERWLRMPLSHANVTTAMYFMGLQVIALMPLNYFAGTFMVFGMAHRGVNWQNAQRLMLVVAAAAMAMFRAPFAAIAIAQFVMVMVYCVFMLIDLYRLEPQIFPTLRYWDRKLAVQILAPSGYFAMLTSYTIIVFQFPILIIRRVLGADAVVIFSVMRTLFSMARQVLQTFTASIGPEVTLQYGRRDWRSLAKIYLLSERILFTAIPVLNFTVLLAAPILLQVWLHKPWLFSLGLYTLMAIASAAISVRDHKFQFQISTNTHRETARNAFVTYLIMILATPWLVKHFGLAGFVLAWMTAEMIQAVYVLYLNHKLFGEAGGVELMPVLRLAGLLALAGTSSYFLARHLQGSSLFRIAVATFVYALVLIPISGWTFNLPTVYKQWRAWRAARAA